MKKILVSLLAFVSLSVFANEDWFLMYEFKDGSKQYLKSGSFSIVNEGAIFNKKNYGQVITKYINLSQSYYMTQKVSKDDCTKGYGLIQIRLTNGTLVSDLDFVIGDDSYRSTTATMICGLLEKSNM